MGSGKPRRKRVRQGQVDAPAGANKRSKHTLQCAPKPRRLALPQAEGAPGIIQSVDDGVLLRIMQLAGYQARLTAMQVCKRWKSVAQHPSFTHRVKPGHSIMNAVRKAKAGDTLLVPPGFYEEMLLFEKPLRVKGLPGERMGGGKRRGVVLQSSRSVVALCNARCYFEDLIFRSTICSTDRAICCFGEDCNNMRFERCEFGGFEGLQVPASKGADCKLVMLDCFVHGIAGPKPAVLMEAGFLRMEGCTVTNCVIGLDVYQEAVVYVKNNDISFNETAMVLEGRGIVANNVFWGNLRRNALEVSVDILDHMSTVHDERVPVLEDLMAGDTEGPAANMPEDIVTRFLANGEAPKFEAPLSMQRVHISGNHLRPTQNHKVPRSAEEAAVRRRVRQLAATTYGAHEQEMDDWQVVDGSDIETESGSGSDWSENDDLNDDDDSDSEEDDDLEVDEHGNPVNADWGPGWGWQEDMSDEGDFSSNDSSSSEEGSEDDDLSSLEDAMEPQEDPEPAGAVQQAPPDGEQE